MNAKLGGYLVGYGLKKRNGEEKKVIFDRPIHNTITKHCLNNLLTLDGTNAVATTNFIGNWLSLFFKSTQTSDRYGVFNSCCLGDGTGETSVNDTDLKHRVTDQTTTKKTGSGWCGTTFVNADAQIKIRVSHTHTINSDFTIKEIGWYNAINSGGSLNYTLSSRVQLENYLEVESGDEFYSIYEITVQFQDVERFSDLGGLGGGYKVNAGKGNNTNGLYYFPTINTSGNPIGCGTSDNHPQCAPVIWPPYMVDKKISTWSGATHSSIFLGKTNINKTKAFRQTNDSYGFFNGAENAVVSGGGGEVITYKDYVMDSFRRDYETLFTCASVYTNIYGLVANGTFYRFGDFDEDDNFTPRQVTMNGAYKFTIRQSWSTDLLTPTP